MVWWWKRKEGHKGHNLDDADRENSILTRKAQANLRAKELEIAKDKMALEWEVQRQEIMDRLDDLKAAREDDDEGFGFEDALMSFLGSLNNPSAQAPTSTPDNVESSTPSTVLAPRVLHLSDEEIMNIVDSFEKKYVKMAAKLPDGVLAQQMAVRMPGYDADTYRRAVAIVKGNQ